MKDTTYVSLMNNKGGYNYLTNTLVLEQRTLDKEMNKDNGNIQKFEDSKAIIDVKIIKLSFLLAAYMFTQDDGIIDDIEQKKIDKMIHKYFKKLTFEDQEFILNFTNTKPDSEYCKNYIRDHNIKLTTFNNSVGLLSKYFKGNNIYKSLLIEIRNQFQ